MSNLFDRLVNNLIIYPSKPEGNRNLPLPRQVDSYHYRLDFG